MPLPAITLPNNPAPVPQPFPATTTYGNVPKGITRSFQPMTSFSGRLGRWGALSFAVLLLAACETTGKKTDVGTEPEPGNSGVMSAAEIRNILSGKSWNFQGPNNSGTTLYADDGTSLVEVNGKGTTRGTWTTKEGQLCESFAPAAFLPNGVPLTCYPFSGSNGTYQAGKATFTLAG
jgi:Protein of unknown function (DUF995)